MKKIKLYFSLTITLILISVSLATSLQFFKGYVISSLASLNNQSTIVRDLFILCIMIALDILFATLADYKRDGLLFDGMTDILTEAMSKKKIKKYMLHESVFTISHFLFVLKLLVRKTYMLLQKLKTKLI